MKLATKIRVGHFSLAALVLIIGGVGVLLVGKVSDEYDRALNQTLPVVDALHDARLNAVRVMAFARPQAPRSSTTNRDRAEGAKAPAVAPILDALDREVARHRRLVEAYFPAERKVADGLGRASARLRVAATELTHAAPGSAAADAAHDAVKEAVEALFEATQESLVEEETELAEYQANVVGYRRTLQWAMAGSTGGALAIALVVGAFAARRLTRPIIDLRDVAARFARRDLGARAAVFGDDEVAQLAIAFNDMAQALDETMVSRDYVENILARISDGVLVLDAAGAIRRANPAAEALLARSEAELSGRNAQEVLAEAVGDSPAPTWPAPGRRVDAVLRSPSRPPAHVQFSLALLVDQERPAGAVLTLHDVSALMRAEGEMRQRLRELEDLNRRLGESQNQLLHSDKMAAIGQLAAGVAHEINNPVGFISANLGTMARDIGDIVRLLKAYEALEAEVDTASPLLAEIRAQKEASDLAYLVSDLPNLIAECRDGTERVRVIVHDLKTFSHVDDGDRQWANLEKCLDSTLNMVWHDIKYKAKVIKDYHAIPEVCCRPSQINQVFMNLLVNAGHAIAERGTITLRTGSADGEAWVVIEDTGTGIAPEHLKRIFEPFFTTKPVGQGTGLGLSLVYSIIERHHGRIEVSSEIGKGTRFCITLPIDAQAADSEDVQAT